MSDAWRDRLTWRRCRPGWRTTAGLAARAVVHPLSALFDMARRMEQSNVALTRHRTAGSGNWCWHSMSQGVLSDHQDQLVHSETHRGIAAGIALGGCGNCRMSGLLEAEQQTTQTCRYAEAMGFAACHGWTDPTTSVMPADRLLPSVVLRPAPLRARQRGLRHAACFSGTLGRRTPFTDGRSAGHLPICTSHPPVGRGATLSNAESANRTAERVSTP